jgi:hypothetical protein
VIPDAEVVPERAHSSKVSGKVLQVFQRTKVRELNPREKKIYYRLIINDCPIAVGVENPHQFWMCR